MLFGDKKHFAIEADYYSVDKAMGYVYGNLCYWINGKQIGFLDEYFLLSVMSVFFYDKIKEIKNGVLYINEFNNKNVVDLFNILGTIKYGIYEIYGGNDYEYCLKYSDSDIGLIVDEMSFCYGVEPFNHDISFLVKHNENNHFIIHKNVNFPNALNFIEIKNIILVDILNSFNNWIDELLEI